MKEKWKDIYFVENDIIYNYIGLYQISNLGNLKSIKNKKSKLLILNKSGRYAKINLWNKGKSKTFLIHRLVALMFLENPCNYNIVNHKNVNKTDNRVINLEWCTQSHNIKESYKLGLQKPLTPPMRPNYVPWNKNLKMSKEYIEKNYKVKPVNQYTKDNIFIKRWSSIKEAENTLNIAHISACCKNLRKSSGGYIWKYAD